jgi:hypothetical protein
MEKTRRAEPNWQRPGLRVAGGSLLAVTGAGFALSTLGGYLLSVWIGPTSPIPRPGPRQ